MKKSKLMIIALLLGLSLLVVPIVSASQMSFPAGMIGKSTFIPDSKWSLLKNDPNVWVIERVLQDPNNIGPGWVWSYTGDPGDMYNPMVRFSVAKYSGFRTQ